MNRFQRTYAQHSAWTPADPLAALDPEVRRAILLMPPTWRERWKMRPLTSSYARREAMLQIIAERRLAYELRHNVLTKAAGPEPERPVDAALATDSPYYRYRLSLHQQAMQNVSGDRQTQDAADLANNEDFRREAERRASLRQAWADIAFDRARLEMREQRLLKGEAPDADDQSQPWRSSRRPRSQDRGR